MTAKTGYTSHGRMRLWSSRRTRCVIHTTSASRSTGATQAIAAVATTRGQMTKTMPASASHPAAISAQRCGWSLRRVDSRASSAAPAANAKSTAALITCSRAPPKTSRVKTRESRTAVKNDTITIHAMLRVDGSEGGVTLTKPAVEDRYEGDEHECEQREHDGVHARAGAAHGDEQQHHHRDAERIGRVHQWQAPHDDARAMCQHKLQGKDPKEADSTREIVLPVVADRIGRIGDDDRGEEVKHDHGTEIQNEPKKTPLLDAAIIPVHPPQDQAVEDEQDDPRRMQPVGPDTITRAIQLRESLE